MIIIPSAFTAGEAVSAVHAWEPVMQLDIAPGEALFAAHPMSGLIARELEAGAPAAVKGLNGDVHDRVAMAELNPPAEQEMMSG